MSVVPEMFLCKYIIWFDLFKVCYKVPMGLTVHNQTIKKVTVNVTIKNGNFEPSVVK